MAAAERDVPSESSPECDPELLWAAVQADDAAGIHEYAKESGNLHIPYAGQTAVHYAAAMGHVDALQSLISNGASLDPELVIPTYRFPWRIQGQIVETQSLTENTPLHAAAVNGHVLCLQALINAGAQLDARNRLKQTALLLACKEAHSACTELLLRCGANPRLCGGPLDRHGTPLHRAAERGDMLSVLALMASKCDINAREDHGVTPLHLASKNGHAQIVGALLSAGADPCVQDSDEKTPLYYGGRHKSIVFILKPVTKRKGCQVM